MSNDVIVIGGGAAGLIAAGTAGMRGKNVLLIEKNSTLGRKLMITGKGRCNLTNIADIKEMMDKLANNKKFLYSALNAFPNKEVISFFNMLGVEVKVERGGRAFPVSDKAGDIVDALKRYIKKAKVKVITGTVDKILSADGKVFGVRLKDGGEYLGQKIILATGGLSYPQTGSTGDGYRFAKELGHRVTDLKPALVPLEVKERWVADLEGLSLKNVALEIFDKDNMKIYKDFGDMTFTDFGLTGPIILSASSYLDDISANEYILTIDLKPALTYEMLNQRILRDFQKYSKKYFCNSLNDLLPQKIIPLFISLSQIEPEKRVNQISREERLRLIELFKKLTFHLKKFRPISEAIITAGGVNTDEVKPNTMESRLVEGLYFAGEILDVHGLTGGYNLQIAFSTGYLAGSKC